MKRHTTEEYHEIRRLFEEVFDKHGDKIDWKDAIAKVRKHVPDLNVSEAFVSRARKRWRGCGHG